MWKFYQTEEMQTDSFSNVIDCYRSVIKSFEIIYITIKKQKDTWSKH